MEKIVSLCKRRGFIFPGSDIYGGLANSWDYGPYGVELKNNIKRAWWKANVYLRNDMYGMDAAILMHPRTWEASGHVQNFSDPLVDCKKCNSRFRGDNVKKELLCGSCGAKSPAPSADVESDKARYGSDGNDPAQGLPKCKCSGQMSLVFVCPTCGTRNPFTPRKFNLMFKTVIGPLEDSGAISYLRPETAQGMFVNFANILDSRHPKLPFGLAQIGKSFRNEITPGNFTFRTREFEQMEIEYFCRPEDSDRMYEEWVAARKQWYLDLGMKQDHLRFRAHEADELAHYAKACTDVEYEFPWGWSELEGIANRTDFDLKRHAEYSGKDLMFNDDVKKEKFFPYIIEPSGGVDRCLLAFLVDAYNDTRVVLKLHKDLVPVKVAVLPLLKNRPELVELAKKLAFDLKKKTVAVYDDTAAIGKLYRRQDEIGTLFCVTVDVQSLEDRQVTVRHRDSMQQERISLDQVDKFLLDKLQ